MLVCVCAGHSVAVIHPVYRPGSWCPGSWFLVVSYRAVRPSKPSNLIPGAIVPNHTVRPLVPPYSAVYGVWLVSRGLPWWWVVLVACPGVDTAPLVPGGVPPPGVVWGSGALPTVGRGRWWVLPHYRGAPMVGCPLQWGWVDSGCFPTIGVPGLWVLVDSGCLPTIKALSDVALTFK